MLKSINHKPASWAMALNIEDLSLSKFPGVSNSLISPLSRTITLKKNNGQLAGNSKRGKVIEIRNLSKVPCGIHDGIKPMGYRDDGSVLEFLSYRLLY